MEPSLADAFVQQHLQKSQKQADELLNQFREDATHVKRLEDAQASMDKSLMWMCQLWILRLLP